MTMRITRRELVQRGAAGVTILSLPGLLAACGGSSSGGGGSGEVADVLRFSNWPLYIDYDEKTKKHPTLDQFTQKTGIKVDYFEDINDNASYFAKVQGPLSQGRGIDRDIFVFTDSSRYPQLLVSKEWVEPARQGQDPEHLEPHRRAEEPDVRPRPDVQPSVAVRDDRHRVERGRHGACDVDPAAPRRPEAQGQGHDADRDGRLDGARDARQRRRPLGRHGRDVRQARSAASRRRSTTARSGGSPATTTRSRSPRATSPRPWPGRATSCSCSPRTRSSSGRSRRRAR